VNQAPPTAIPVANPDTGLLEDVLLEVAGRTRHLCGRDGETGLETAVRNALAAHEVPVFLGFGLGRGPAAALSGGADRAVVVDLESRILEVTLPASGLASDSRLVIVSDPDPEGAAQKVLTHLPAASEARIRVIAHPAYLRLNRAYYTAVADRLHARAAFRRRVNYSKFTKAKPRVLLVQSRYFLVAEVAAALKRLEIPTHCLPLTDLERGQTRFIEALLHAITTFRPDFLLTINHLGLDREGRLLSLLEDLNLPLASWFVDNPQLILHDFPHQTSPWCTVFTWDRDTVPWLADMGFSRSFFLPLATDPERFHPPRPADPPPDPAWTADVSFVGSSMVRQVREALSRMSGFPGLVHGFESLAAQFAHSSSRNVGRFLKEAHPQRYQDYVNLPDVRKRLDFELLMTWEATRQYRTRCVTEILPFSPVIAGDSLWHETLPSRPAWRHVPRLDYYRDLPRFYPLSKIGLNCTSMQMKGAINQRVFDIPACGGFVLTDRREQLDSAFEPDETACYEDPSELAGLVRHYLATPYARQRITRKAQKRILADHTYVNRLSSLIGVMRRDYS